MLAELLGRVSSTLTLLNARLYEGVRWEQMVNTLTTLTGQPRDKVGEAFVRYCATYPAVDPNDCYTDIRAALLQGRAHEFMGYFDQGGTDA